MVDKELVREFWSAAACGENLYLKNDAREDYIQQANHRYLLEPMIQDFAQYHLYRDKNVLEIGTGLGAEHQLFAAAGAILDGVDLTERAVEHTAKRLKMFGLNSNLKVADAEHLPFADDTYDLVYSWGVLHHTPDTKKSIAEVYRVLKKDGQAKIMIYHKFSMVGYMLWIKYGLLKLRPMTSLSKIYANYLESPGTKAYSVKEAKQLFKQFKILSIETMLTHGDLLSSDVGQRHRGLGLNIAKSLWPRWLIRKFFKAHGLYMLIKVQK